MESEIVKHWADQARYDVQTAGAMWDAGRYVYVVFCCQQAIEKALKAIIIGRSGELAPRIHNLSRLAELAGVELDERQRQFLEELSVDYMRTRYPDQMAKLSGSFPRERAESALRRAEEMTGWLLSMLK